MAATDARPVPKKNVAYRHYFTIRKNDGTIITTWAGQDSERSLDGATAADCTNEAVEIGTNSGMGYIDLTATEMNTDCTMLKVTVTNTDAVPYVVALFPEDVGDIRTNMTAINDDATNGNNATLSLKGLNISSSTSIPLVIAYSGISHSTVEITGNGSENIIGIYGGGTANCIKMETGGGNGNCVFLDASSGGRGLYAEGGATGIGVEIKGGSTSGEAVKFSATSGDAFYSVGGAAGAGAHFEGGVTSGPGLHLEATGGNGRGLYCTGFGAGQGARIIGGATGAGVEYVGQGGAKDIDAGEIDAILADTSDIQPKIGTPLSLGGGTTLANNLLDIAGSGFVSSTDSNEAIRNRGDAAWTTGGGGGGMSAQDSGTAQAGSATNITLAATASAIDDTYNGSRIVITGNTGEGQVNFITDYDGTTKIAQVRSVWLTSPDGTSTYEVQPALVEADIAYLTDIMFNRNVISRHSNEKPQQYTAGTGTNQETINTTQDGNGNTETETKA